MSDAVAEYGRIIGQESLASGYHGSACRVEWDDGSTVEIEEVDDHLLVCLAFDAPHPQAQELLLALQSLDQRQASSTSGIQVGLSGQGSQARMVVLARVPSRGADGHGVQEAVRRCQAWRNRWESSCNRHGQP